MFQHGCFAQMTAGVRRILCNVLFGSCFAIVAGPPVKCAGFSGPAVLPNLIDRSAFQQITCCINE